MRSLPTLLLSACLLTLFLPNLHAAPPAPRYSVTDLGTLGGDESVAYAINNRGQIVGGADTHVRGPDGEYITYVFLWSGGAKRKLNNMPGRHYYAAGINDRGQIAGAYSARPESGTYTPFLYANGKLRLLGALPRSGGSLAISEAYAINNAGQVVGVSNGQAFSWKNGKMRGLPMPPRFTTTTAFAVNGRGQIAGSGVGPGGTFFRSHALFWQGNRTTDLGTLPGFGDTEAHGINARGQVIGWTNRRQAGGSPVFRAFLWQSGKMRDLGTLPGIRDTRATALNDRGDIVGRIVGHVARKGNERAVLWRGGHLYNLNDLIPRGSGWVLEEPVAINNAGWIIGNGKHNRIAHAFLLRPR
ncbi:MAG: hypothetical protein JO250_11035 [Armatimonadetes bacterium]|nr:hypothetical protein [Armatimonadota bacterium]